MAYLMKKNCLTLEGIVLCAFWDLKTEICYKTAQNIKKRDITYKLVS